MEQNNIEQSDNRGNNKGVTALLILIIIILGAFCILVINGTISFNKSEPTNDKQTGNNEPTTKSIKIDEDNDYVYEATYKYDNKYSEYVRENSSAGTIDTFGITISYGDNKLKSLKVPFININSDEAKSINKKLEELYLKYAKGFDKNAEAAKGNNDVVCTQVLNYKYYKHDNMISVLVYDDQQCTSPFVFNYQTYTFDLTTGKLLSYDDVLSKLGLDKEATLTKLEGLAKDKMAARYSNNIDLTTECHYNTDEDGKPKYGTTNCYEITNLLLKEAIDNKEVLFFVDNDGNLNVLTIFYLAFAQNGDRNYYLITLNK